MALRGLHDRVPQYNNFDFIKDYEGTLTVVYDDDRLQRYTDVAGEPVPALIMLKIPANEYAQEKVIAYLRGFDNVRSCGGDYQVETAPSGEQMVWINWLGSSDEWPRLPGRGCHWPLCCYTQRADRCSVLRIRFGIKARYLRRQR